MDDRSCGLMLQGRATFERALAAPDSLADLPVVQRMAATGKGWLGCEEMLYAARNAYERSTGSADAFDAAFDGPPGERPAPPGGDRWDVEDDAEMRRRLPRLAELFLPL